MAKATYLTRGETPVFDQLFVSTFDKSRRIVEDLTYKTRAGLAYFFERKDTTSFAGSEQIRVPLLKGKNPNGGWISENEGLSLDDYDPYDAAIFYPKHCGYNVTYTREQQRVNRGSGKLFSLVQDKIKGTAETMRDLTADGIWTGQGGSTNEMEGIQRLIPATLPASQSVSIGGINPSTESKWRSQAIDMDDDNAISELENRMITMWNNINNENGDVDVCFCDQTTAETYEKNAMGYAVTRPTKIADVTFELLQFKRKPIIYDFRAPTGELRMIDGSAVKLCIDPGFWFKWTDQKEMADLPLTKFRQIVSVMNMVRFNPRKTGCIFNISES